MTTAWRGLVPQSAVFKYVVARRSYCCRVYANDEEGELRIRSSPDRCSLVQVY